jgi:hypothetical protein
MSFSGRIPWPLAWTVLLFDGYTALARNVSGALLFASAGNHGESVDKETCFIGCWEKALAHAVRKRRGTLRRRARSQQPEPP